MNEWTFFNEFKTLCEYYKDRTYENKKITKMYYEKVKNMSLNDFKKLCDKFMFESKFMPKIAEFSLNENNFQGYKQREYNEQFFEQFYEI